MGEWRVVPYGDTPPYQPPMSERELSRLSRPAQPGCRGFNEREIMPKEYIEPGTRQMARVDQKWKKFVDDLTVQHDAGLIEWKRRQAIIAVLDRLGGELRGVHYTFLPDGDLIEITGASQGPERGSIQLEVNGGRYVYVCRPISLICFAFSDLPQCSYFDLELSELRRKDKTTEPGDKAEKWHGKIRTDGRSKVKTRMSAGAWEREAAYTRVLRGRIVIFSKGSGYAVDDELIGDDVHDLMSREQFRKCVEHHVDILCGRDRSIFL